MVLESCKVKFESTNDNSVFYADDTVKGTVCIVLSREKKFTDLTFHVKGVTKCRWRQSGYGPNALGGAVYSCKEEEFKSCTFTLLKGYPRIDGNVTLDAGLHEFPFKFSIPCDAPTSFESKYGRIRYTFNVTAIQAKFFSVIDQYKTVFSVVSRYDLNNNPKCAEPTKRKVHKNFSSLFANKGFLDLIVSLPMTGFVPGQDIVIDCGIRNISQVKVMGVKFKFYQLTTYKSSYPRKSSMKEETVIREYSGSGADKGQIINYPVSITVPALPPSTMYKSHINNQYFLKVKAIMTGSHSNQSITIPLTIGNVPLYKTLRRRRRRIARNEPSTSRGTARPPTQPPYEEPMDDNGPPAYHELPPPTYEESQASYKILEADPDDKEDDVLFTPAYPVFHFPQQLDDE